MTVGERDFYGSIKQPDGFLKGKSYESAQNVAGHVGHYINNTDHRRPPTLVSVSLQAK